MKNDLDNNKQKISLYPLYILLAIILLVISSYFAISELSDFKNAKDTLTIIISIIALFTTFGGAYLGAKISGDNARKLDRIKRLREINDTKNKVKVMLKMNLDNVNHLHNFICRYYSINREEFLLTLLEKRNDLFNNNYSPKKEKSGKFKTFDFVEKFMKKFVTKLDWHRDIFKEINSLDNLINELNNYLIYIDEDELNIIFQLKQVIDSLSNYIYIENGYRHYSMPHSNEYEKLQHVKGYFMLFSILLVDLYEKVLDIDIENYLRNSE